MYDGIIVRAGWENLNNVKQGFGLRVRHQVVTDSGANLTLVYGHLSQIAVKEGQQVYAGDRIGLSGDTGHVDGAHLHVEIVDSRGQYKEPIFDDTPPQALENPPKIA
jgi:murein DD-endopeptidase MepM/ murein hydrolase activator NlpD